MRPITVVLVEDHALVRRAFRSLLEDEPRINIVAEGRTGLDAIALAREHRPDVLLLDVAMPEMNGIEAAMRVRAEDSRIRVLVVTMHADEPYVRQAMRAGVKGYVLKDDSDIDLARAVLAVARNRTFLSPGAASVLAGVVEYGREAGPEDPCQRLTERERQILKLVAEGYSNKEIGTLLDISHKTVAVHRSNLMTNLNIRGTAKLTLFAIKNGLLRQE